MYMIGHDDEDEKVVALSVEEKASIEYDLPCKGQQSESFPGIEGDEVD